MIIPKRKQLRKLIKALSMLFLWFFVIGLIVFLSLFLYLKSSIPDPESIALRRVTESTKIYDRTGQTLLYDIHGEEKRTIVPWEKIPESVKKATLAAEDSDFYNHKGIDFRGILRAIYKDIRDLDLSQGGSTITQQLIKKALLGDQKTITRKIKEWVLAIEVERRFTKDEIFWMYLNQIPYGSNAYGIEAASKTFFDKSASDLTLAEAATLASIPKATTYYSPYGNNVGRLMARKDFVLGRMKELGYITEEQYKTASNEKIVFSLNKEKLGAPHFVIMVKEYLNEKYGEEVVENGGLKITTTLDVKFQELASKSVSKYSQINKERYKAKNAAMVAIDPKSGDILALVGSANYFDIGNEGNFNVATARRQPGSSFKPFAYAAAFEKGYPDGTILFDLKTEFNPNCGPAGNDKKDKYGLDCYHPNNYDMRFRGPVNLRQSLAQSLNIPSVKVLHLAGISDTIELASKMGITTLDQPQRYGLSLVLGGAEVKLVDITSAYGVFANDGIKNDWSFILKVESSDGTVLEEKSEDPKRVLDSQIARLINNILSDNSARAPVFGYSSSLYIPGRSVAAKTGTTQENRDAWVIGYSPSLAVGVWVGNNKNESMTAAGAGISAAGPMWREFMGEALKDLPNDYFISPNPVTSEKPMLNGDYRYNNPDTGQQEIHSILYYTDDSDPQFNNWEWSVSNYFRPSFQPTASPAPI